MMMHHCRQILEDSERIISFGLPLNAATETPNQNTGLNKLTGIGPGTPFVAPTTARQLDMEPLDCPPQVIEERDPEPHSREAKKVEPHNSCNQTLARDRKTGGAKGKQNTCTIATNTRPGATKQVVNSRGKPTKSTDPHSTNSLLDTEVHKDTTRPTQQRTHPQFPDGPSQWTNDPLTGSAQGSKAEKPTSPKKSSPSSQVVTDLQPDQTKYSVDTETELPLTHQANPERDSELLTGPTPQRQVDSGPRVRTIALLGRIDGRSNTHADNLLH